MNIGLRILILEDNPHDAELMQHELSKGGLSFVFEIVDTKEGFQKSIEVFNPDIILADYSLPQFDGLSALAIAREKCPDIPFVFVTGTMGEEIAVDMLKNGATDYVLKERLSRLVPAVNRALRESHEKAERKRAEDMLRETEERYRTLIENANDMIQSVAQDGQFIFVNSSWLKTMGYTWDELQKITVFDILHPSCVPHCTEAFQQVMSGNSLSNIEAIFVSKDGRRIDVRGSVAARFVGGKIVGSQGIFRDITERKRDEEAIRKSEGKYRNIFDNIQDVYYETALDGTILEVSPSIEAVIRGQYTRDDLIGKSMLDFYADKKVRETLLFMLKEHGSVHDYEITLKNRDGSLIPCSISALFQYDAEGKPLKLIGSLRDITERKQADKKLSENREQLKAILDNVPDIAWLKDRESRFIAVNKPFGKACGVNPDELPGRTDIDIWPMELAERYRTDDKEVMETRTRKQVEEPLIDKDGNKTWIETIKTPVFNSAGEVIGTTGIARDITERKKIEEELHDNYYTQSAINMILSLSLENISIEMFLQKALNMILSMPWLSFESRGSIHLIEETSDVLVLKAQYNLPESLIESCARVPFGKCLCGKAAQTQKIYFADRIDEHHEICYEGMLPHGHYNVPILYGGKTLGVINVHLNEGHIKNQKEEEFLIIVADTLAGIIIRKQAENKIQYLAYYDELTGIPNRSLFLDRLTQGIARADYTKRFIGVLSVDIDRFQSLNDTYGLDAGDLVLREVAGKLTASVREGDTVARLGSDNFGILLIDIAETDDIILVVEKIMNTVSQPVHFEEKEIMFTISVGISAYPSDGKDASILIRNADLALAKAKQQGRKNYKFYTEGMDVKASEFVLMEKNLFNAMKNEEFILYYQPYWDINTKKITGMEALIRWKSPESGLISPGKFIPILEDTGMIIEVGEWILRTAVNQVKEWQDKGYPVVPVSVNLSMIQFRQKDLANMIERVIREAGFYPSLLTLEITESAFMQDIEFTYSVLESLKNIGVSVSIDDFGTGYSSLAHLKRFPIDNLKIDMSFIREIAADPDTASIVTAIIAMAHTLNLKTIAEGIETEEQWKILRLLRCDMGQGFYLSKPLPAEEIEKLLIGGANDKQAKT
ncbi:MAG: EAL domain-containing protein [Thermodesulfovibrionales bacterium]